MASVACKGPNVIPLSTSRKWHLWPVERKGFIKNFTLFQLFMHVQVVVERCSEGAAFLQPWPCSPIWGLKRRSEVAACFGNVLSNPRRSEVVGMSCARPRAKASAGLPRRTFKCQSACSGKMDKKRHKQQLCSCCVEMGCARPPAKASVGLPSRIFKCQSAHRGTGSW
eukprot:356350-Pelagomonas_calceolata.AAC.1